MSQDETHNATEEKSDSTPLSTAPSSIPANLFLLDPTNQDFISYSISQSPQPFRLFNRPRVILLMLIMMVLIPLLMVFEGISNLSGDMQLAQSSITAHGQITNRRSVPIADGRGRALNYYLVYRFYAAEQNAAYTNEQLVNKDTYDQLNEGTPVDIKYVPTNPRISKLTGSSSDSTRQNGGYGMVALGLIGTCITGGFAARQLIRLQEEARLRHSGQVLIGHINRCAGKLKITSRSIDTNDYGGALRGNYMIDVYYRFRTPTNDEIRGHEVCKRNDLLNKALPGPDTPLAVLYLDDKHYKVL